MTYASKRLSLIFSALADQTRRGIFDELRQRPQSVTDLQTRAPSADRRCPNISRCWKTPIWSLPRRREATGFIPHMPTGWPTCGVISTASWDQALLAYAAEITTQNKQ